MYRDEDAITVLEEVFVLKTRKSTSALVAARLSNKLVPPPRRVALLPHLSPYFQLIQLYSISVRL